MFIDVLFYNFTHCERLIKINNGSKRKLFWSSRWSEITDLCITDDICRHCAELLVYSVDNFTIFLYLSTEKRQIDSY